MRIRLDFTWSRAADADVPRPARQPLADAQDEHCGELTAPVAPARSTAMTATVTAAGIEIDPQRLLVDADLAQLLAEAVAPVVDRPQTFMEWWHGADPREEQLAKKIQDGRTANVLLNQRLDFVRSVAEAQRLAAQHRLEQRQAALDELKLEEEIAERTALRQTRIDTQRLLEERKQQRLLEQERPPASSRERVLDEHRLDRQARVHAARQQLDDFLSEIRLVCESRVSIHERALMIRNLLSAFEMDEESLPTDARSVLTMAERIRNGA